MEGGKLAVVSGIYIVALMAFAAFGEAATFEEAGSIAPSPSMESAGLALSAPAIVAAMVSLIAYFF